MTEKKEWECDGCGSCFTSKDGLISHLVEELQLCDERILELEDHQNAVEVQLEKLEQSKLQVGEK